MFNLTNKQAKVLDELIMMEKATETKNAWISFRLLANVSAKEIAKDYGKSILVWREIETEEGKRKTAKTMYTIKINGKLLS